MKTISIQTSGDHFIDITQKVQSEIKSANCKSGIVILFCPHTSCGLSISENYDPSAKEDLENFLRHLAPQNLSFIKHTCEGPDDSPSHMKSILVQPSLHLIIKDGEIKLGTWQGIFLTEFRTEPRMRNLWLKIISD